MRDRLAWVMVVPLVTLAGAAVIDTNWRAVGNLMPSSPPKPFSPPSEPVEILGHRRGNIESALVGVVEWADFQCPFSKRFAVATQPGILEEYVDRGLVLWTFRHLPLTEIHSRAKLAASMAECAGGTGRFWQAHDALFANWTGGAIFPSELPGLADMPSDGVSSCIQEAENAVERDMRDAASLGLGGTPSFLIGPIDNGRIRVEEVIVGNQPAERFRKVLDSMLTAARGVTTASESRLGVNSLSAPMLPSEHQTRYETLRVESADALGLLK